jgi:hypothetical protein
MRYIHPVMDDTQEACQSKTPLAPLDAVFCERHELPR